MHAKASGQRRTCAQIAGTLCRHADIRSVPSSPASMQYALSFLSGFGSSPDEDPDALAVYSPWLLTYH